MINETVMHVVSRQSWGKKPTLTEVVNSGRLFTITEQEFDNLLESEQLDEGVKEILQKARTMAAKLPANIQQAAQIVKQKTGKALDATNTAYVKAQNMIDRIPLVGRIPQSTRNRLILGLALSLAGAVGNELSAGETGTSMDADVSGGDSSGLTGGGDEQPPQPQPQPQTATQAAIQAAPAKVEIGNYDNSSELVNLRTNMSKVDQNVVGDRAFEHFMNKALSAAKQSGETDDQSVKQQLIQMIKSYSKSALSKVASENRANAAEVIANTVGLALNKKK